VLGCRMTRQPQQSQGLPSDEVVWAPACEILRLHVPCMSGKRVTRDNIGTVMRVNTCNDEISLKP